MVSIVALWLPILVSAVFVFVVSSLLHMVLPLHAKDFQPLPAENDVMEALGKFSIPPGDYMMPCPRGLQGMRDPDFKAKFKRGPVGIMTLYRAGEMNMGPSLLQWFVYLLVVGVFAAYVSSRAVGADATFRSVFRFAGVTAFLGYFVALAQESIWYHRSWATTAVYAFDGLVYALITGATFGWLWPH